MPPTRLLVIGGAAVALGWNERHATLDAIDDIHRRAPLSPAILVERYRETRPTYIGPPWRLKSSFLALVARLFGETFAASIEPTLDVSS